MAEKSWDHAEPATRDRAAAVSRRHLLTTRGSQETPPRVVLHLPDLDALSAVAIGPPRPASRRRVDPPHAVVHDVSGDGRHDTKSQRVASAVKKQLVDLVKAPVGQVIEQVAPNGKLSLPRLLIVMQQPKLLLAGVAALGLQFAAIIAMFTGGSTPTDPAVDASGSPQVAMPQVSMPSSSSMIGGNGPIQTPLSAPQTLFGAPIGPPSSVLVAQPALPPPQPLPGLDSRDVPPWAAGNPASEAATAGSGPTIAPPLANQPGSLNAPSLPQLGPNPSASPVLRSSDVGVKPRPRLEGTIRRASISETAP